MFRAYGKGFRDIERVLGNLLLLGFAGVWNPAINKSRKVKASGAETARGKLPMSVIVTQSLLTFIA
jgi:hypothetical protein